jgi:hypothetical protein
MLSPVFLEQPDEVLPTPGGANHRSITRRLWPPCRRERGEGAGELALAEAVRARVPGGGSGLLYGRVDLVPGWAVRWSSKWS